MVSQQFVVRHPRIPEICSNSPIGAAEKFPPGLPKGNIKPDLLMDVFRDQVPLGLSDDEIDWMAADPELSFGWRRKMVRIRSPVEYRWSNDGIR